MLHKNILVHLNSQDYEVLDGEFIKHASDTFLPEGHTYDPDFLYMKVRGVSAGEYWGPNKNADFFPEHELIQNYKTFLSAHAFKNHENKDIANAIGDVVDATWNIPMRYVELLIRIDRRIAPSVARGFEKGYMTDVSMGCKITHSVCSICGNIAKVPSQYCDHIKFHKHEVYPDGRRVYEINIGPKFHDISAVLTGADRAAKVTGLMIVGSKVAVMQEEEMEKAASFEEFICSLTVQDSIEEFSVDHPFSKSAQAGSELTRLAANFFMGTPSLPKTASSQRNLITKAAAIQKEIESKILSVARGRVAVKETDGLENLIELFKLFYTDFLTQEQCGEIADKICDISSEAHLPASAVFERLLMLLDVAGIELSPLEFQRIMEKLCDSAPSELPAMPDFASALDAKREAEAVLASQYDTPFNLASVLQSIGGLLRAKQGGAPIPFHGGIPAGGHVSIIIRKAPSVVSSIQSDGVDGDLMRIVQPMISDRSLYPHFLMNRVASVVDDDAVPNLLNVQHFIAPMTLENQGEEKLASCFDVAAMQYGYSQYQAMREKMALCDWKEDQLHKYADELDLFDFMEDLDDIPLEKTAAKKGYTLTKALLFGTPAVFGYSAIQRARMRNGENVSDFNRYIAENPANAALLQTIAGPALNRGLRGLPEKMKAGSSAVRAKASQVAQKPAFHNLKKLVRESRPYQAAKNSEAAKKTIDFFTKKASEDLTSILSKESSELLDTRTSMDGFSPFQNSSVDAALKQTFGASDDDISAIKLATVLYAMEDYETQEALLTSHGLPVSSIDAFLKEATKQAEGLLSKEASAVKEVLTNAGIQSLLTQRKSSIPATLAGSIVDGVLFKVITDKISAAGKQKNPGATTPAPAARPKDSI